MLLDEIIDHKFMGKIKNEPVNRSKRKKNDLKRHTGNDCEFCVSWKDVSTNWVVIRDLKESYALELAEYVVNNRLERDEAISWWVPYVLKK